MNLQSRFLHVVDEWTAKAWVAIALSAATLLAVALILAVDDTTAALTVFAAVVQAVTLTMVFVVQHTQERDQKVSHRKLDELLRALQDTDPRALRLEEASDDEIDALAEKHTRARRQHSDRAVHR